ncbi:unnamed protein product, partial [Musa acuminata subsp. burmannicoides]
RVFSFILVSSFREVKETRLPALFALTKLWPRFGPQKEIFCCFCFRCCYLLLLLIRSYRRKQGKMTVKLSKAEKKVVYDKKLCALLDEYSKVLIAGADNVGSNQLQNIRKGLRGDSIVLMGKNTLIRRCIKIHAERPATRTPSTSSPSSWEMWD